MEPSTTAGSNNAKDGEKLIVPETTTTTTITLTYLLDQKWFAPMLVDRLGAKDALRFAAVSRNCRVVRLQAPLDFDDTPATATGAGAEPRTLDELGRRDAYHAQVWHTLPRIPHNMFHTVLLTCSWRDQGWGNSKGMLSVATNDGRAPDDYKPWSDRIVCGKEPAPHKLTPLCLQFRPYTRHHDEDDTAKDDKHGSTTAPTVTGSNEDDNGHTANDEDSIQPYTIWYRIGGGGGHRLIVKDLCVRILTYAQQHHEQEHEHEHEQEHEQQGLLR